MALNDPTDSLMREVNDAVRHDRMVALWRQYRAPLLAAAIALVVATAGTGMWKNYQEKRAGEAMQQFTIAQQRYDAGEFARAADDFATTADMASRGELRDLAHLWQGRALAQNDKMEKAVAVFEQVATQPEGKDLVWRDLACLHLVGIDSGKAECLKAGASPLAGERELVRASLLWKAGKSDDATSLLTRIANTPTYSEKLRNRARDYLSITGSPPKQG